MQSKIESKKNQSLRVIAIDPGFERVGVAVVEKVAAQSEGKKELLLFSECFKTSAKLGHDKRLVLIGEEIKKVIKEYAPTDMAIEELFFNENQKTAFGVAEARGVIIYEAARQNVEVYEYTPSEIKIAVTGYGRSAKEQVISMVSRLIAINKKIAHDDEFDAIAVGLTHIACKR